MAGITAGVVGLLAWALYSPVFTTGVTSPVAVAAFVALSKWAAPPRAVVPAAATLDAPLP